MAYNNIYDSIEFLFSLLSFFGLAPFAFRTKTSNPYLKLDYFSIVCAAAVLGVSIAFEIIFLQQDIDKFLNEAEPIDRLTILTYSVATNMRRTIVVLYFITPLLHYKQLINVIKTLYETDQVLSMKGIVVNHKNVFLSVLGLLAISLTHVIVKTVAEFILTYLVGQRFARLSEYLSSHNEKDSSTMDEKKLSIRQAWMSVGCDTTNNISILSNLRNFSPDNTLCNAMNLHAILQKCMEELSECFQMPLMFLLIHEFLTVIYCFYQFYGVIAYGVEHLGTMDELMVEIHSFIQAYAKLAAMTWCCDVLVDQSRNIVRVVNVLTKRSDTTLAEKRKLRQFYLQLVHSDNGVSVMGFYNIDNMAHFSILTTMFNYLMVTISLRYY
ncbi:hypothetical protein CBL_00700 [Carabus blaptoides fortunei]